MLQKYRIVISLLILIITGLLLICSVEEVITNPSVQSNDRPIMKGLCWVAGDSIGAHNMDQITKIGADWISQTPFGWMNGHDSPEVVLNSDKAWWGENDKGIRQTAEMARKVGIKSMLKPHIWLRRSGDKWRSDIEMNSPAEWDMWFASYRSWIVHYAKVAEYSGIESLCIGTELYQTTKQHPEQWRSIIADIRKVYSGELTYAANWYKEYEDITFWDDLDYIGIQAYFPLSNSHHPSKKQLLKAWKKHKKELKSISEKYGKKIVFTEIGYKNTADAAKEPWTWPQDLSDDISISEETQVICYEALFESVWEEPWYGGQFIWKWFHTTYKYESYDDYFEASNKRRAERAQKRNEKVKPPVNFTPQRGKAMEVLEKWYLRK